VPPAAELSPPPPGAAPPIPMRERYETRYAVGGMPFSGGSGSGSGAEEAVSGGWIRLAEPRPMDHLLLAALTDAWVPPIFVTLPPDRPVGVPTIDLTIHFRSPLPPPGGLAEDAFVFGLFRSRMASGGFVEEDGEIWSPSGVLLAQSRQLALVLS
jgi:acyl-CoA thioesterase